MKKTSVEAKKYLNQLKTINYSIRQKKAELMELRTTAEDINAVSYGSEKVAASRKGTDAIYVNDIIRIAELEKKIREEIMRLSEKKHEIISRILSMDNEMYTQILTMRYVDLKSFDDIASETEYTYQYVINLHRKAIDTFGEIYEKTILNAG